MCPRGLGIRISEAKNRCVDPMLYKIDVNQFENLAILEFERLFNKLCNITGFIIQYTGFRSVSELLTQSFVPRLIRLTNHESRFLSLSIIK